MIYFTIGCRQECPLAKSYGIIEVIGWKMIINLLLLLIPISIALCYIFHTPPVWVFFRAFVAIIPFADWTRRGTERGVLSVSNPARSEEQISLGVSQVLIGTCFNDIILPDKRSNER